jgi:hypothetical protein
LLSLLHNKMVALKRVFFLPLWYHNIPKFTLRLVYKRTSLYLQNGLVQICYFYQTLVAVEEVKLNTREFQIQKALSDLHQRLQLEQAALRLTLLFFELYLRSEAN